MKFMDLPDWLYFPLKILLVASFFVPVLLWGGQMLGYSKAQETVFAQEALRKAENRAKEAGRYMEQERETIAPEATAAIERGEEDAQLLFADAERYRTHAALHNAQAGSGGQAKTARGIDVSHYQGLVRWDRVAKAGIHFAYVKATAGKYFVDTRFHENWHGMRTGEIYRGAYHFFYAADDPVEQAKHFVATIRELKPTDLPPVLDVEILDHTSDSELLDGILIWLKMVEKALGRTPVVYTDPIFGDRYLKDERLSKYPLWIADYSSKVGEVPAPWKKKGWTFWQHSQKGIIAGVEEAVDLSIFNGSVIELEKFIAASRQKQASK
jgi:lysozyme